MRARAAQTLDEQYIKFYTQVEKMPPRANGASKSCFQSCWDDHVVLLLGDLQYKSQFMRLLTSSD